MSDDRPGSFLTEIIKALPEYRIPKFDLGPPLGAREILARVPIPSESLYKRLRENIAEFEKQLDPEHEIGVRVVSFGPETIHIDDLGYHGPDLVIFYGTMADGSPVHLLQHISQTNLLLVALKKRGPEPKRVGFQVTGADESAAT